MGEHMEKHLLTCEMRICECGVCEATFALAEDHDEERCKKLANIRRKEEEIAREKEETARKERALELEKEELLRGPKTSEGSSGASSANVRWMCADSYASHQSHMMCTLQEPKTGAAAPKTGEAAETTKKGAAASPAKTNVCIACMHSYT